MDIGTLTGTITLEDQLSSVLLRVNAALAKTDDVAGNASNGMRQFEQSMTKASFIGSALGNVMGNLITRTVSFTTNLITGSLMAGARLEQLGVATRFLGEKAGYAGKYIDDLAEKIEKSGIDGVSARESIVQLLNAHIDLAQATKLSAIAQNMQSISGRTSSEVFEGITRAISTQNPEILRNLGFTISLDQITKQYTETTGLARKTIDSATKQQLIMNAVLEQGAEKAGLYGESMTTAGKQASSAERAWDQVSQQIGTILLPITNVAIKSWYHLGESVRDSVKGSQAAVSSAVASIAAGLQSVILSAESLGSVMVSAGVAIYQTYAALPRPIQLFTQYVLEAAAAMVVLNGVLKMSALSGLVSAVVGASAYLAEFGVQVVATELVLPTLAAGFKALWVAVMGPVGIALGFAAVVAGLIAWKTSSLEASLTAETLSYQTETLNKAVSLGFASEETDKVKRYAAAAAFLEEHWRKAHGVALPLTDAVAAMGDRYGDMNAHLKDLNQSVASGWTSQGQRRAVADALAGIGDAALSAYPALQGIVAEFNRGTDAASVLAEKLKALREDAYKPLSAAQKQYITEASKVTDNTEDIIKALDGVAKAAGEAPVSGRAVKMFLEEVKKGTDAAKAVDTLVSSLRGVGKEALVFQGAFAKLRASELADANIQEQLMPLYEKNVKEHHKMTEEQDKWYLSALDSQDALRASQVALLDTKNVTLSSIEAWEAAGESQEQIERRLDTTTDALKRWKDGALSARAAVDELNAATDRAIDTAGIRAAEKQLDNDKSLGASHTQLADDVEKLEAAKADAAIRESNRAFEVQVKVWRDIQHMSPAEIETRTTKHEIDTGEMQANAAAAADKRSMDERIAAKGRMFAAEDAQRMAASSATSSAGVRALQAQLDHDQLLGKSSRQLAYDVEMLEAAKAKAAIDASNLSFKIQMENQARTVGFFDGEEQQLITNHDAVMKEMTATSEAESAKRILQFEYENNKLIQLGKSLRATWKNMGESITSNIGGLFLGLGHDVDGSLHAAAKRAKEAYDTILASGKHTSAELANAFKTWHDAEDAANETFGERFKKVWFDVKTTVIDTLNQILKYFVEKFIVGLVTGSKGAQGSVMGMFGGGGGGQGGQGGGGGIGGSIQQTLTQKLLAKFGMGGASAAGTAGASSMAADVASSMAVPGTIGTAGASAGAVAPAPAPALAAPGLAAALAGPVAGGLVGGFVGYKTKSKTAGALSGIGTGAAVGMMFGGPIGAGIGAIVGGVAGLIGGWLGARKERKQVEAFREQFENQFSRYQGLPAILASVGRSDLFQPLETAKKLAAFRSSEKAIVEYLAGHPSPLYMLPGVKHQPQFKAFNEGGFVPPNDTQMSILHGGGSGEIAAPIATIAKMLGDKMGKGKSEVHHHTWQINVNGGIMDRDNVRELFKQHIIPLHKESNMLNTDGYAASTKRALG